MVREIPLTQNLVALVDEDDFEGISKFKWYAKSNNCGNFYAARVIKIYRNRRPITILMHRFILAEIPISMDIDHIDRNSLNNQRNNLRFVTRSENILNSERMDNADNIRTRGRRHQVRIVRDGTTYNLGTYSSYEAALKVRNDFLASYKK